MPYIFMFFVEIPPENKMFPSLSTIPNLVPVPPKSMPIANGLKEETDFAMLLIVFTIQLFSKIADTMKLIQNICGPDAGMKKCT